MTAHITHASGEMEPATAGAIDNLLDELESTDDEHSDVSISDESGWTLSAFRSGRLVWENVEQDVPARYVTGMATDEVRQHFQSVLAGRFAAREALPWEQGSWSSD